MTSIAVERRKLVSVLFLIVFLLLAASQAVSESGTPHLVLPSSSYDAGTVWEGETLMHTYEVRNEGNAELKILEVKPG